MKHYIILSALLCIFASLLTEPLFAGVEADLNGDISTDHWLRLDSQEFTRNDVQLTLKIGGSPGEKYHYYSEMLLKGLRDTADDRIEWEWDLREAYLDLYTFISDHLDLRLGRQIIAWGAADQLNPTSNVSPDDLEDMFDFGKKLGVNALQATVYVGDVTVTGIFIPEFVPAELPAGDLANAFAPAMTLPAGMTLRTISQCTTRPERTLQDSSQYAFKLGTTLFEYDVSLSYFYGRDDLPLAQRVVLTPADALGTVDLETTLIYPRMHVIGADMAGQIKSIGVWAEGALFLPDKVEMQTLLSTSEGFEPQGTTTALDDEPFLKYIIGLDYTFKNGWYVNAQFLHGFFHERGADNLHDYFVCRFEKDLLNDTVKIVPFGIALAVIDWDDIGNNYGVAGNPELTYKPTDNVELILGAFILEGAGQNMFSQISDQDQVYFKAKISF